MKEERSAQTAPEPKLKFTVSPAVGPALLHAQASEIALSLTGTSSADAELIEEESLSEDVEIGVRQVISSETATVRLDGQPIVIGSSSSASIRVPGPPLQAAVVYSDGMPMVTRLQNQRVELNGIEVAGVGVPITRHAHELSLPEATLDLSQLVRDSNPPPALVVWVGQPPFTSTPGVATSAGCAAVAFGTSGQVTAERATSIFSGVGRRCAFSAVEATSYGAAEEVVVAVLGVTDVDGEMRVVVAARGAHFSLTVETEDGSLEVLPMTEERPGIVSAECAYGRDVTVSLVGANGAPIAQGRVVPLS